MAFVWGFLVGMVVMLVISAAYVRFKKEPYWLSQIQELQKKLYQAKQEKMDSGLRRNDSLSKQRNADGGRD